MRRALPDFDRNGNLPPGVYEIYSEDDKTFEERFGWNSHRRRLLAGLKRAAKNMAAAGVREIWIDGSFITAKELPADIDGAWLAEGVIDVDRLDPVFLETDPPRISMKKKYGVDFLPADAQLADPDAEGGSVLAFFQKDRDGNRKGIVKIDIS
jgi:hypothetical protein